MRQTAKLCTLFVAVLALMASWHGPARATSVPRTWVSSTGTDAGTCGRSSPCATFNFAYSQTNAGGEIYCVDAGSFGIVTIAKSITISCDVGTAAISAPTSSGVQITVAATDVVNLRGLDINGFGDPFSFAGIAFSGAGELHVAKCVIRGFTQSSGPGISGDDCPFGCVE